MAVLYDNTEGSVGIRRLFHLQDFHCIWRIKEQIRSECRWMQRAFCGNTEGDPERHIRNGSSVWSRPIRLKRLRGELHLHLNCHMVFFFYFLTNYPWCLPQTSQDKETSDWCSICLTTHYLLYPRYTVQVKNRCFSWNHIIVPQYLPDQKIPIPSV